jgi:hypothetical protein
MLATKWRLGMTDVCGMKKVGHTSIQCLRALDAPERACRSHGRDIDVGANNPDFIGDILNKVVATKCCVRRGSANR